MFVLHVLIICLALSVTSLKGSTLRSEMSSKLLQTDSLSAGPIVTNISGPVELVAGAAPFDLGNVEILENFALSFDIKVEGPTFGTFQNILRVGGKEHSLCPAIYIAPGTRLPIIYFSDGSKHWYNVPNVQFVESTWTNVQVTVLNNNVTLTVGGQHATSFVVEKRMYSGQVLPWTVGDSHYPWRAGKATLANIVYEPFPKSNHECTCKDGSEMQVSLNVKCRSGKLVHTWQENSTPVTSARLWSGRLKTEKIAVKPGMLFRVECFDDQDKATGAKDFDAILQVCEQSTTFQDPSSQVTKLLVNFDDDCSYQTTQPSSSNSTAKVTTNQRTFIQGPMELSPNNTLAPYQLGQVDVLENFRLSLKLRLEDAEYSDYQNILHIGGADRERAPGIYLGKDSRTIHVSFHDSYKNLWRTSTLTLPNKALTNIEVTKFGREVRLMNLGTEMAAFELEKLEYTSQSMPWTVGDPFYPWAAGKATVSDILYEPYPNPSSDCICQDGSPMLATMNLVCENSLGMIDEDVNGQLLSQPFFKLFNQRKQISPGHSLQLKCFDGFDRTRGGNFSASFDVCGQPPLALNDATPLAQKLHINVHQNCTYTIIQ